MADTATARRLTVKQVEMLKMFGPNTYGIALAPNRDRRSLEMRGLIEWVPPKFGTPLYGITLAGRKELERRAKAPEAGQ
jgi:hypothetical protein